MRAEPANTSCQQCPSGSKLGICFRSCFSKTRWLCLTYAGKNGALNQRTLEVSNSVSSASDQRNRSKGQRVGRKQQNKGGGDTACFEHVCPRVWCKEGAQRSAVNGKNKQVCTHWKWNGPVHTQASAAMTGTLEGTAPAASPGQTSAHDNGKHKE